jgi:hypothetical protein
MGNGLLLIQVLFCPSKIKNDKDQWVLFLWRTSILMMFVVRSFWYTEE